MDVYIAGSDNIGWSIDKDRQNLEFFFSLIEDITVVKKWWQSDVIWFVWYNQIARHRKKILLFKKIFRKKIIATVVNNQMLEHPELFDNLRGIVDVWVSPNTNITEFLQQKNAHCVQINFFVDPQIFCPLHTSKKELCADFNISYTKIANKLVICSFMRDSLGRNLHAAKWHKNPELLIDIVKKLPKESFVLLLAGPRRHFVIDACKTHGIPYVYVGDETYIEKKVDDISVNKLTQEEINKLYNIADVCIITSKSEGGPKAVYEASLSKTMLFSTPVGCASDILDTEFLFSANDSDRIVHLLKQFIQNPHVFDTAIEKNYEAVKKIMSHAYMKDRIKAVIEQL